jgi:predicted RNase H-like nuclease (RuvC/YqgF family)
MDTELERYHKSNGELELSISELHLKQEGLKAEVLHQRSALGAKTNHLKRYQHDLHEVAQCIQVRYCPVTRQGTLHPGAHHGSTVQHVAKTAERNLQAICARAGMCSLHVLSGAQCNGTLCALQEPKELKDKIKALYQKHINAPAAAAHLEEGVAAEYARQRDYLERTVRSLKSKLDKDTQLHRTDNLRIMQENVALIKEISELRREIKLLKAAAAAGASGGAGGAAAGVATGGDAARELEMQREVIGKLRDDIRVKEERIGQLEAQIMPRPMSRERLPPMEGFGPGSEVAAR